VEPEEISLALTRGEDFDEMSQLIVDTLSTAKYFKRMWTLQEAVTAGIVSI
jgi:hypothetical protein